MGAPVKLNNEVQEEICRFIALGLSYEVAARAAGVCVRTFEMWRSAARRGASWGPRSKGYMQNFLRNLEHAEAICEAGAVEAWNGCIQSGDWKAAQALLSVRYPERWAKRTHIDVTTKGEKMQQPMSIERFRELDREAASKLAEIEKGREPTTEGEGE